MPNPDGLRLATLGLLRALIPNLAKLAESASLTDQERRAVARQVEAARQELTNAEAWIAKLGTGREGSGTEPSDADVREIMSIEDRLYELHLLALDIAMTAVRRRRQ